MYSGRGVPVLQGIFWHLSLRRRLTPVLMIQTAHLPPSIGNLLVGSAQISCWFTKEKSLLFYGVITEILPTCQWKNTRWVISYLATQQRLDTTPTLRWMPPVRKSESQWRDVLYKIRPSDYNYIKSNKNSSVLKHVLKCCLPYSINWTYLRNTLLELWSSFPEPAETSQRMLFLSSSGVWDLFHTLSFKSWIAIVSLTMYYILCLVGGGFLRKWHRNFLKHFAPTPYFEIV